MRDGLHIYFCFVPLGKKPKRNKASKPQQTSFFQMRVGCFVCFLWSLGDLRFYLLLHRRERERAKETKEGACERPHVSFRFVTPKPAPHDPNPATRRGVGIAGARSGAPRFLPFGRLLLRVAIIQERKRSHAPPVRHWLLARVLGLARAPLLSRYYIPLRGSRLAPLSSRSLLLLAPPSLPRLHSSVSFVVIVSCVSGKTFYSGRSVLSRGCRKR